jgi:hypothetical protein
MKAMSTTAFSEATSHRPAGSGTNCPSEREVLDHLLDVYPRRLTLQELAREVGVGLRDDAVQRAVDNLAAARFVRREGAVLIAAPAVVNFDREPIAAEF